MNLSNTLVPEFGVKYMFMDLNSYFASCEQQDFPDLRGRAVVVAPSDTDYTCAIAASYEAKAFGIKTGTKILDAKRLCPSVVVMPARHKAYMEYHHRIVEEVVKHTPVGKIWSIDELDSRLMPRHQTREAAIELGLKIKQGLRSNVGAHVKASIAFAPNSFLGKTGTELQKPDGLVVIEGKDLPHILNTLDLSDLCGIGFNMRRRLQRAGIHTIDDLWHCSPKRARAIWRSVGGERFWYNLHGVDIPQAPTNRACIGHSRVLDPEHRSEHNAFQIMRRLVTKAVQRLRRENYLTRHISLSIKGTNNERWWCDLKIPQTDDVRTLLHYFEDLWINGARFAVSDRYKHVSIVLSGLIEKSHATGDLFETMIRDDLIDKTKPLDKAMETINGKFGPQTINFGLVPDLKGAPIGTKIAFSRVPNDEEFRE